MGSIASLITNEIVAHRAGAIGSRVEVTLEIDTFISEGVSEQVVRIVTENSRTLKFKSHGFETE